MFIQLLVSARLLNGLPLAAAFDDVRAYLLLIGLATVAGGVIMMILHKRTYDELELVETDPRIVLFEYRKFRRRTTVSSLIGAMGVIMAALYWAIEPTVFAILISLILILIIAILGLATLDMLSISIQGISRTDDQARQAMIDEYLRRRETTTGFGRKRAPPIRRSQSRAQSRSQSRAQSRVRGRAQDLLNRIRPQPHRAAATLSFICFLEYDTPISQHLGSDLPFAPT